METANDKIVKSAFRALTGELPVYNESGMYCLRVVRQIVQDALDIDHEEFYRRFMKHKAVGTAKSVPYARDVQYSLRQLGYRVKEPKPGDIGCSYKPMPYGHIWVYVTEDLIIENTGSNRPMTKRGYLGLTHVKDLNMPIEVFRLRE